MIRRAVLCVAFLLVVSPALVASGTPSAPKVSQVHSNCYLGAVGIEAAGTGAAPRLRQFGTSHFDQANGIALDASGVYVSGLTWDALPGQTSAGSGDAFLRKYDASGNVLWTRQFGSSDFDQADNVAVDASGAYVAGVTAGAFPGQTSAGSADAFVIKYDTSGNVLWTRQFGSSSYDLAWGMALDASGAYVAGRTGGASGYEPDPSDDAFVRKYDAGGNLQGADQLGSSAADS